MAKRFETSGTAKLLRIKKRRKGRHSKKRSVNKNSKNYKKPYRGQGKLS